MLLSVSIAATSPSLAREYPRFRWRPERRHLSKLKFFLLAAEGLFSNRNIGQVRLNMYFCFILLFTSSSPCRKDQFAVLCFSTSYYSTDPGLQLGDPAPLNDLQGLSLWICWYIISQEVS